MQIRFAFSLTLAALAVTVSAQSFQVVPAAAATTDAFAYEWLAGATRLHRQQTLIGASHLGNLQGRSIQAIELRRTTVAKGFAGGSTSWVVSLSTSPNTPVSLSNAFASNVGTDVQQVFSGVVALPASPATTGPGSAIAWTSSNTVRVVFQTPFVYQGGTLCIDITGTPIAGQQTWWMADAAEEVVPGTDAVQIGSGCGIYGGPTHDWSEVHERSLVPGGYGVFRANGTPNGPAFAMFGQAGAFPFPLSLIGIPTPGCVCYLDPLSIVAFLPATFEPEVHPLAVGATAEVLLKIPATPSVFGFQMTTQWFDLLQLATSNAITWTVATAIPQLDMALVEGHPNGATGTVSTHLAHVVRLEYQ